MGGEGAITRLTNPLRCRSAACRQLKHLPTPHQPTTPEKVGSGSCVHECTEEAARECEWPFQSSALQTGGCCEDLRGGGARGAGGGGVYLSSPPDATR
jgi:hypothetical protein